MEAIDQNFEDEDYEFEDYSDSNSLEYIKEKNIEKLNESFCDSLDIDLDNSFSSHLSKEIDINNNFPKKKKTINKWFYFGKWAKSKWIKKSIETTDDEWILFKIDSLINYNK